MTLIEKFNSFFKSSVEKSDEKVRNYIKENKDHFENDYFDDHGRATNRFSLYDILLVNKKTGEEIKGSIFGTTIFKALKQIMSDKFDIRIEYIRKTKAESLIAGGAKIYDIHESA